MFSRNLSTPLLTDSSSAFMRWWERCYITEAPPYGHTSYCPVFWLITPSHSLQRDTIGADYVLFGPNVLFNWKLPAIRNFKFRDLQKKSNLFFLKINNKAVFLHHRTVILTVYMDAKQTGPKPVFTCVEDAPHNYPSMSSGCSLNHIDCNI